jgi:DNA modification methylase
MMIPARTALAAQADGWYIRDDIAWIKPNQMPQSVKDRFVRDFEYIFMLTKKPKYYFDKYAVLVPYAASSIQRVNQKNFSNQTGGEKDYAKTGASILSQSSRRTIENFAKNIGTGRAMRTAWIIPTRPSRNKHYASYPEALVKIPVLASTSAAGCCQVCGVCWNRIVVSKTQSPDNERRLDGLPEDRFSPKKVGSVGTPIVEMKGWEKGCDCVDAGAPVPCTVLDPFSGSGTTITVAKSLGRNGIGIDLNPEYVKMGEDRAVSASPEAQPQLELVMEDESDVDEEPENPLTIS